MLNSMEAVQIPESTMGNLDEMFGNTPVDKMIRSIDAQVKSDTSKTLAEDHSHAAVLGRSLDDDIEQAARMREAAQGPGEADVGEGNDAMEASESRATDKAMALKALREAQDAFTHVQSSAKSSNQPPVRQPPVRKAAPQPPPVMKTGAMDSDSEDPIDEMKSLIDAQEQDATKMNTQAPPEDPLDKAIDQISVVRAQERAKLHQKKLAKAKKLEDERSKASTLVLLQELEDEGESLDAPGDPGETMPPNKSAPPGPPNPPVKEVTKDVPQKQALGRSTKAVATSGLDAALSQEKSTEAPSKTGPADAAPPPPDKDFSQEEIKHEMEAIGAYPVSKEDAISEYVSKMVPWHQRPDPPNKSVKGPPAAEQKIDTAPAATAPAATAPAAANATNSTGNASSF